jgi:hypothetical protein
VRAGSDAEFGLASLIRDPLIRLVMKSDGVTEQAMMALMDQVRRSLTLRAWACGIGRHYPFSSRSKMTASARGHKTVSGALITEPTARLPCFRRLHLSIIVRPEVRVSN